LAKKDNSGTPRRPKSPHMMMLGSTVNPLAVEQRRRIRELEREAADQRVRLQELYARFGERVYTLLQNGHPDPLSDKEAKFYLARVEGAFEIIRVAKDTADAIRSRSVTDDNLRNAIRREKEYLTPAGNAPVILPAKSSAGKRAFAPVSSPKPAGEKILPEGRYAEYVRQAESMREHDAALFLESLREVQTGDENAAAAAAHGLGRLSHSSSVDLLRELAKIGPEKVRVEAVDALARISGESILPLLTEVYASDKSHRVRLAAVRAHYQVGRGKDMDFILKAIDDEAPTVRRRATTCLGWLRNSETVPGLTKALTDSDPSVRRAAADALGHVGDPGALPALMHAIDDSDRLFVDRVLKALQNVTGEKPPERVSGGTLVAFWKDWYNRKHIPSDKRRSQKTAEGKRRKTQKKTKKKAPPAKPDASAKPGSEPDAKENP